MGCASGRYSYKQAVHFLRSLYSHLLSISVLYDQNYPKTNRLQFLSNTTYNQHCVYFRTCLFFVSIRARKYSHHHVGYLNLFLLSSLLFLCGALSSGIKEDFRSAVQKNKKNFYLFFYLSCFKHYYTHYPSESRNDKM